MSTVPAPTPKKPSPHPVVFGCGGLVVLLALGGVIAAAKFNDERAKPATVQTALVSLAGVPIYPGATYDEAATRDGRATQRVLYWREPEAKNAIAVFRTPDDSAKVMGYYETALGNLAFQKTTINTKPPTGGAGATYINLAGTTTIIVTVEDDPGEDRRLTLQRSDSGAKPMLGKPDRDSSVVTPDDFKKIKH